MHSNYIYFYATVILLAIAAVVGYTFFFSTPDSEDTQEVASGSADALYTEEETAFQTAESLFRSGRDSYESARSFYEDSLEIAQSPEQEAHIRYKIALTYTYADPEEAIRLFKELIADPTFPDQQKAYAIQHMYAMFRHYVRTDEILPYIFSGDPYASMWVEGDIPLSFRYLSEYGTTFGNAPYLEINIARWHSLELLDEAVQNDPELREQHLRQTVERLANAERFLAEADQRDRRDLLPYILSGRAAIMADLARVGEEEYRESYADAYEEAVQVGIERGLEASMVYAFMANAYRLEDEEGIRRAQPYFLDVIENIDEHSGFKRSMQLAPQGVEPSASAMPTILLLAERSPEFRQMLLDIGWTEEDFS